MKHQIIYCVERRCKDDDELYGYNLYDNEESANKYVAERKSKTVYYKVTKKELRFS